VFTLAEVMENEARKDINEHALQNFKPAGAVGNPSGTIISQTGKPKSRQPGKQHSKPNLKLKGSGSIKVGRKPSGEDPQQMKEDKVEPQQISDESVVGVLTKDVTKSPDSQATSSTSAVKKEHLEDQLEAELEHQHHHDGTLLPKDDEASAVNVEADEALNLTSTPVQPHHKRHRRSVHSRKPSDHLRRRRRGSKRPKTHSRRRSSHTKHSGSESIDSSSKVQVMDSQPSSEMSKDIVVNVSTQSSETNPTDVGGDKVQPTIVTQPGTNVDDPEASQNGDTFILLNSPSLRKMSRGGQDPPKARSPNMKKKEAGKTVRANFASTNSLPENVFEKDETDKSVELSSSASTGVESDISESFVQRGFKLKHTKVVEQQPYMNPGKPVIYGDAKKEKPKKKPVVRLPASSVKESTAGKPMMPRPVHSGSNWTSSKYDTTNPNPVLFPLEPPTEEELAARAAEAEAVDVELGLKDPEEPQQASQGVEDKDGIERSAHELDDDDADDDHITGGQLGQTQLLPQPQTDLIISTKSRTTAFRRPKKISLDSLGLQGYSSTSYDPADELKEAFGRDIVERDALGEKTPVRTPGQRKAVGEIPEKIRAQPKPKPKADSLILEAPKIVEPKRKSIRKTKAESKVTPAISEKKPSRRSTDEALYKITKKRGGADYPEGFQGPRWWPQLNSANTTRNEEARDSQDDTEEVTASVTVTGGMFDQAIEGK
jgi:hypothetical protein